MNNRLLIFALEYNGYHSKQGTALSKRARQIAESFTDNGWHVTVIHKDQVDECKNKDYVISSDNAGPTRIAVKCDRLFDSKLKNVILRKIETLYYILKKGDRSDMWAQKVIRFFPEFGLNIAPDYIISMYQPRAPLTLGDFFSKKLNVPWIADFQDDVLSGIPKKSKPLSAIWAKKVLRSAQSLTIVSPEWAASDGKILNRKLNVIRHAIPAKSGLQEHVSVPELIKVHIGRFKMFYAGSLDTKVQSLDILKTTLSHATSAGIPFTIFIAGNPSVYEDFKKALGPNDIVYLGWLPKTEVESYMCHSDCNLLITCSDNLICVPSKFYELCNYPRPIWIVGRDNGSSFKSLASEWQFQEILTGDPDFQKKAFIAASKGDFSNMFEMNNCKGEILRAEKIFPEFYKLMKRNV